MNCVAENHVTVPLLPISTFVLYFSSPPVKPLAALKMCQEKKSSLCVTLINLAVLAAQRYLSQPSEWSDLP